MIETKKLRFVKINSNLKDDYSKRSVSVMKIPYLSEKNVGFNKFESNSTKRQGDLQSINYTISRDNLKSIKAFSERSIINNNTIKFIGKKNK